MLFDMDGTLTEPLLDFPRIKAEMGLGDRPILEALDQMSTCDRARAEVILHRHEADAARRSTLNPGCRETLAWLAAAGVPTALVTRNSRASVRIVLAAHDLPIDVLVAREDAPPKPDPEPLRSACRRLSVDPASAWMVGDGVFDVQAGQRAGIRTVWLSHRRSRPIPEIPWREVSDLWQLIELLQGCYRSSGRPQAEPLPPPVV